MERPTDDESVVQGGVVMLVVASLRSLKALKNVGREIRARLQFRAGSAMELGSLPRNAYKTPFVFVQES
jgi:hypothetical protein